MIKSVVREWDEEEETWVLADTQWDEEEQEWVPLAEWEPEGLIDMLLGEDDDDEEESVENAKLSGGHWVTMSGSPVYIKGGVPVAGNPQVIAEAVKSKDVDHKSVNDLLKKWSAASAEKKSQSKPEKKTKSAKVEKKDEASKPSKEDELNHRDRALKRDNYGAELLEKKLVSKTKLSIDSPPPKVSEDQGTAAANLYTSQEYEEINNALRSGKSPKDAPPKPYVERLQRLAQQELPEPTIVYRGISGEAAKAFVDAFKSGGEVEMQGMVSTTLNPTIAAKFAATVGGGGAIVEIKAKRGIAVGKVSDHSEEREIVQAHGTKYRMVGTRKTPKGQTVYMLEEI